LVMSTFMRYRIMAALLSRWPTPETRAGAAHRLLVRSLAHADANAGPAPDRRPTAGLLWQRLGSI
jgi:hypothetical protein